MKTKPVLGLTDVNLILDAAQKEADANGWPVTIAGADDGGHVLGLRRLDATAPFTAHVAMEKARSAAMGRKETQIFEDMINNGRHAFLSAPLQGLLAGGVPVQLVGALGQGGEGVLESGDMTAAGGETALRLALVAGGGFEMPAQRVHAGAAGGGQNEGIRPLRVGARRVAAQVGLVEHQGHRQIQIFQLLLALRQQRSQIIQVVRGFLGVHHHQ